MIEKNSKKKNEKGAITLYVILACLFFVFILAGVYMSSLNKLQVQEKEVKQIEENYKRQIDRIEEIDQEISGEVEVKISHEPKMMYGQNK